jgi:hypothetical protein
MRVARRYGCRVLRTQQVMRWDGERSHGRAHEQHNCCDHAHHASSPRLAHELSHCVYYSRLLLETKFVYCYCRQRGVGRRVVHAEHATRLAARLEAAAK